MVMQNPLGWAASHLTSATTATGSAASTVFRAKEDPRSLIPAIRRITVADLMAALGKGFEDFKACRTDVIFLCLFYPIIGLLMARLAVREEFLPLAFPLLSGFALIGPVAGTGLYEMSRRREAGGSASWADAFSVVQSPRFAAIMAFGVVLAAIFGLWLFSAEEIYRVTLGPAAPTSLSGFFHDVTATSAGWALIGIGIGVGFLFAVVVLAVSVVSVPVMLDRGVGLDTALWTSVHVATINPGPIAVWGLIVAAGLVLGSIPFLLGLVIVLPVLGHATWHLYRSVVAR